MINLSYSSCCRKPGPRRNIKTVSTGVVIFILKIRRSWGCHTFKMGIPVLVIRHLCIDMGYVEVLSADITKIHKVDLTAPSYYLNQCWMEKWPICERHDISKKDTVIVIYHIPYPPIF